MTNPSKVEKIQTHFQALFTAATSLNTASDELTKGVGMLDEALRKLNVGLTVWVPVSSWVDELRRGQDEIGYCKVNGKWGISLCRSWGDDAVGEDTVEGLWPFNEAPRELRLAGVDKLPELIEALSKKTLEATKKVEEKTKEVRELTSAIGQIASSEKKRVTPPPAPAVNRAAVPPPAPPAPPNATQQGPLQPPAPPSAKTISPDSLLGKSNEGGT